jgi:hypothetical protein
MTAVTEAFAERLLAALPALRPRYETTAAECRAEGLADDVPDVFLDEYSRDVLARYAADPAATAPELAALGRFLEGEYGRADDVDRLIESCFLALLPGAGADPDPAGLLGTNLLVVVGRERAWRARPADVELVRRLVAAVPELAGLVRDNAYGDHQDVLVHGFLGDLARREAANVTSGARADEVRAVLDVLEAEFAENAEVTEPIAVSFVENLPYPDEPGAALVDVLPPGLRAELHRQRAGS